MFLWKEKPPDTLGDFKRGSNNPNTKTMKQKKGMEPLVADPIRAELNIEKWPAIWRPAHSRKANVLRILEREHPLKEGSGIRARVEVGFSHLGELTTEDQKTYYALVKHWEDGGRSGQQTFFSIRSLARTLGKRWGSNVITAVTDSLRRLRATPVSWVNSYFDNAHRETLREIDTFNILSELKIICRLEGGEITREAGYFRFNDFTLNNLLANHTKPVLFETILQFRSELAQLLYTHLDLILADKHRYERRSKELFSDLGLAVAEYERVYERKRAIARAIAELQGVPLTTGMIVSIGIEKTRDGKDYKLTVAKGSRAQNILTLVPDNKLAAAPRSVATPAFIKAEELVKHFYKKFHNVDRSYPQSKEIGQATALTAQHGFDQAKYIIDYAHLAAAKTGYLPQTFGGILQYASRAVAAYDDSLARNQASLRAREETQAHDTFVALEMQIAETKRRDAEKRLASLPKSEYESLYAKTKEALKKRSLWLGGQSEDSNIFRHAVHSAMIAELISATDYKGSQAA